MIYLIIYIIGVILMPIIVLIAEKMFPGVEIYLNFAYDMPEFIFIISFWPIALIALYFKIIHYLINK